MTEEEHKTPTEKKKDLIEQANESALRLEKANEELKTLLEKQELMHARGVLGGQTSNAPKPDEKPKEETPQEYVKRVMEGRL